MQVAYDHPLSINLFLFPSLLKKKPAWSQLSIKNSMFPIQKTMIKSQFPLRITEPEGPLTGRGGSVTPLHPQSWRQSGFSLSLSWVVCQDLDSVEAMWINYLPDYLSLKTYSPGAKCLHSFYLEVVSRIRVKQMRSRKTAYKLFTLIILSVTLVTCPAEFLQDSLKTYLQFVFFF